MNWRKIPLLKILITLFLLNSVSFFLYFFTHPDNNIFHLHRPRSSEDHSNINNMNNEGDDSTGGLMSLQQSNINTVLKPWPILPSYLPWSQNQQAPFGSCEAYFGNGFTHQVDLLKPSLQNSGDSGGWFRCFYSQTLHSSICEGAKVRMFPEKIRMSRGGEDLKEVIGRGEDEELPEFEAGAFDVDGGEEIKVNKGGRKLVSGNVLGEILPPGRISRHTMRGLIDSVHVVGAKEFECDQWVEEPTILVTRFEYANLFHTVTDWYSAYVSSRVTGLPNRPRLVFVDGHCKSQLEETWKALFSSLNYAKNFSGPVCFRHAVFSPLGYETAMFEKLDEDINCNGAPAHDLWQLPDDKKTARISEFGEMIRAAFGFPVDRHHLRKSSSNVNVLFVRREDYLAHPRHGGKVQSRLSNEQEVFDALKEWASESHMGCKINLVNGLFAHMTMKEQVQAIQDASVIIGAHGAGLTHMVSALPNTVILEIISRDFRRPHFRLIAQWKGLQYHAIDLMGSYAEPPVVINKLNDILKGLGC